MTGPFKNQAKDLLKEIMEAPEETRLSVFMGVAHRIESWAIEDARYPHVTNPPDPDNQELSNFLYRASQEYTYKYRIDVDLLRFLIKYGLLKDGVVGGEVVTESEAGK